MTIRSRVRNGIKWLNKNKSDWRKSINQNEIDMSNCTRCILGQVFGNYLDVVSGLSPNAYMSPPMAVARGFQAPADLVYPKNHDYYAELAKAWKSELRTR